MKGKRTLYIDQYGTRFYCKYVKDLKEVHSMPGKVRKMYRDTKEGEVKHVGYVVGQYWLTAYVPYEKIE